VFTPIYLAHFRFTFFNFADLAFVNDQQHWVFRSPLYSGYGVGIRVRNERLVFKAFQVRLAYYPRLPYKDENLMIQFRTVATFNPGNFFNRRPEIIGYN